jgi:peptidoglycan-N-acetylmuramic acid deacetylase
MAFSRWRAPRLSERLALIWGLGLALGGAGAAAARPIPEPPASCHQRVYLSFDTGHMGVAPLIADVLRETQVRVTFFAANERTQQGDGSLGQHWASWWRARAQEGHRFASHTFDHVYWKADLPNGHFKVRPSAGPQAGRTLNWSAPQYCAEIRRAAHRLEAVTGVAALPLFRAPGGKTSEALVKVARSCGYDHVGWSPAGFLGDELPSDRFPNAKLLQQALTRIRPNDILVAHLGIWSRQDPWAPAVLRPLIDGLKAKGFCFDTLDHHPAYQAWVQQRAQLVLKTGSKP